MKRRLALNFKDTRDSDLYVVAYRVYTKMIENENFPDPGMLIIELGEINQQFQSAMTEAAFGDRVKLAIKNDVRVLLIKKLKKVGEFVQNEADGAETILFSSGFPLIRPLEEIYLGSPDDFKILPGAKPGEIIMKIRAVRGARSYQYEWTPAPVGPESKWEIITDTRCKKTISGLPLGVNYCFRMAVVGSRSKVIYTDILSRYIS